jgi:hypothetical protein
MRAYTSVCPEMVMLARVKDEQLIQPGAILVIFRWIESIVQRRDRERGAVYGQALL